MTAGKREVTGLVEFDPRDMATLDCQNNASGQYHYPLAKQRSIWHQIIRGGSGTFTASAPETTTGAFS